MAPSSCITLYITHVPIPLLQTPAGPMPLPLAPGSLCSLPHSVLVQYRQAFQNHGACQVSPTDGGSYHLLCLSHLAHSHTLAIAVVGNHTLVHNTICVVPPFFNHYLLCFHCSLCCPFQQSFNLARPTARSLFHLLSVPFFNLIEILWSSVIVPVCRPSLPLPPPHPQV